ncbi:tungsten-containing aldehyde ferredoxin oxidoreductase [Thermosinus carboxydivorans Nor1]|uniref:Tungsten-containing aldehyde ferredoxin oxidoreductase n=1 Tax=Thermosinus carboxydivorans Nor1 TaxID=401526 RepID=A1HMA2_9FIRM|nr:tungsten-containing aldehyde ferredoxin oxidoreductase [Thermosinus carboxydivorans Nor1]
MIANREGIGDLLAEGTMRAGEKISGASYYAMHVKGLEIPMADPRGRWSTWTFGNLTNIRGGDHLRNRNPVENLRFNSEPNQYKYEKFGLGEDVFNKLDIPRNLKNEIFEGDNVNIPKMSKWAEDLISVFNSVGICIRPPVLQTIGPKYIAQLFSALTGIDTSETEVMLAGERTWNMQKLFNLRCGEKPQQSVYPARFYHEPLPGGPSAGRKLDYDKVQEVLQEYYQARGWTKDGVPAAEKLKELNLG